MPAQDSSLYLPAGERGAIAPEDVICVWLVVNGSLGMGAGKVAAQAFQGCLALMRLAAREQDLERALADWEAQGWRTVVRVAETEGLFQRACTECQGVVLRDEGLTEVPDGAATLLVTIPYPRGRAPKVLAHKRLPLF
jgi:peptidyl-tRNA hydrolase